MKKTLRERIATFMDSVVKRRKSSRDDSDDEPIAPDPRVDPNTTTLLRNLPKKKKN